MNTNPDGARSVLSPFVSDFERNILNQALDSEFYAVTPSERDACRRLQELGMMGRRASKPQQDVFFLTGDGVFVVTGRNVCR